MIHTCVLHICSITYLYADTCISKIVVEHNVRDFHAYFEYQPLSSSIFLSIFRLLGLETAHGAPDAASTPVHLELREELGSTAFEAPGPFDAAKDAAKDDKWLGISWDGKDGDCGDQRKMQMQLASYRFAQCRFFLKGYLHIGYHMVTYKIHIVLVHGSGETTFPKRTSIFRQSEWALRGQIKRSRLVKYLDQVCVDLESQSHVWGPENKLNSLPAVFVLVVYFQTIWTAEDVV